MAIAWQDLINLGNKDLSNERIVYSHPAHVGYMKLNHARASVQPIKLKARVKWENMSDKR